VYSADFTRRFASGETADARDMADVSRRPVIVNYMNRIKIIGTCGIIPSLLLFFSALNPLKNRDMIIIIILVYAACMALTYIFLIITRGFPKQEYFNVVLLIINIVVLGVLYPWRVGSNKDL
jgi:hypothetical protein